MTYQSYSGPGARLVEHTLQTLLQRYRCEDISHAIVTALRHLRRVVDNKQGKAGLRRFDADLLYFYNKYRTAFVQANTAEQVKEPACVGPHQTAERLSAILVDAVDNCLLLNAGGFYTSTDVLIDLLLSCLLQINAGDHDLGDLLLDVNSTGTGPSMMHDAAQDRALH